MRMTAKRVSLAAGLAAVVLWPGIVLAAGSRVREEAFDSRGE